MLEWYMFGHVWYIWWNTGWKEDTARSLGVRGEGKTLACALDDLARRYTVLRQISGNE